jgi:hypothetical protein
MRKAEIKKLVKNGNEIVVTIKFDTNEEKDYRYDYTVNIRKVADDVGKDLVILDNADKAFNDLRGYDKAEIILTRNTADWKGDLITIKER